MIDRRLAGRTVLVVFAHPDDESLACGGTIARLADAGLRVMLVTASRGERGSQLGPMVNDELGHIRTRELRAASAALGVSDLVILDHPDGDLRWAHVTEFQAQLVLLMRHHRPAAVITFGEDGLYWHADHIGVYERTTTAVQSLGALAPPLYYVTMARGVMPEIVATARRRGWTPPLKGFWSIVPEAFGIGAREGTVVLDVAAWTPQKTAAILCHQSQMVEGHPFLGIAEADARRLLGTEYFHRARIATTASDVLEQL